MFVDLISVANEATDILVVAVTKAWRIKRDHIGALTTSLVIDTRTGQDIS